MATQSQFEHEDISTVPRGYKVRSIKHADGTVVRLAFPPGPRRKGAGRLVSILHPKNPEWREKISDWGEVMLTQLMDDYKSLRRSGWTKQEAELEAIRRSTAGRGIVSDFRKIVASERDNPKSKTREQVEKAQAKAVKFLRDVAKDDDKADEIAGMSVEEYAEKKHWTISNPRKGRRKNPNGEIDKAAEKYREFHGEDPEHVVDVQEKEIARDTYSGLGLLYDLKVRNNGALSRLDFSTCGCVLARSVDGHQLYIVGGDQDCDAVLDGQQKGKDFVNVGKIETIAYVTRKDFDHFKESAYEHKFGEEGGDKPWLLYNRLSKRLFIVGGDYTVAKPGIIN